MGKIVVSEKFKKWGLGIVGSLLISGITAVVTISIQDHYGLKANIEATKQLSKSIETLVLTIHEVEQQYTTKEEFKGYVEEHYKLHVQTFELLRGDLKNYAKGDNK